MTVTLKVTVTFLFLSCSTLKPYRYRSAGVLTFIKESRVWKIVIFQEWLSA
jgi:hypothetical protein